VEPAAVAVSAAEERDPLTAAAVEEDERQLVRALGRDEVLDVHLRPGARDVAVRQIDALGAEPEVAVLRERDHAATPSTRRAFPS
jgi:hypothetical protein